MARDLVQPHLRNDRRAQGRPLASPRRLPAGAGQRADHLDGETRGLSVTLPMFHGNGWCLPCIVDEQLWDAVQARLAAVAREICRQVHTTTRPPLFRSAQMRFLWWRNGDPRSQGLRNPHMLFDFPRKWLLHSMRWWYSVENTSPSIASRRNLLEFGPKLSRPPPLRRTNESRRRPWSRRAGCSTRG
jgi:hypothetical protein